MNFITSGYFLALPSLITISNGFIGSLFSILVKTKLNSFAICLSSICWDKYFQFSTTSELMKGKILNKMIFCNAKKIYNTRDSLASYYRRISCNDLFGSRLKTKLNSFAICSSSICWDKYFQFSTTSELMNFFRQKIGISKIPFHAWFTNRQFKRLFLSRFLKISSEICCNQEF